MVRELHPLPTILGGSGSSSKTWLPIAAQRARCGWLERASHREHRPLRRLGPLWLADNGCGMSPAFLKDSLFRPFQTTKKKGLGIGMFQSRMIVEAHRGSIQVKSELGVGTTFRVILPLNSKQMKPRLLIVDDDREILAQMKWALGHGLRNPLGGGSSWRAGNF